MRPFIRAPLGAARIVAELSPLRNGRERSTRPGSFYPRGVRHEPPLHTVSSVRHQEPLLLLVERMEQSLLINQAAERLGVSRRTVYYWIRNGRLRTVPTRMATRRVTLESIEA